ncbi:MAG: hypothetical protein ABIS01_02890 [Ferruginibacter sp.]
MKKRLTGFTLLGAIVLITAVNVNAQDTTTFKQDVKKAAKETGHAVSKGAKTVGNKTAEIAAKSKAVIVDKIYSGKQGPDGQRIYINNKAKYYWIDKKGRRHYVMESQLKDKDS